MSTHLEVIEATGMVCIISKSRKTLWHHLDIKDLDHFRTLCGRYDLGSNWMPEEAAVDPPSDLNTCKVCAGIYDDSWQWTSTARRADRQ